MLKYYKILLKKHHLTGKDMAKKLGFPYDSYRSMTRKGSKPKWVESFLIGYNLGKKGKYL